MVRIQLASNFQVVELTYENWEDVDTDELDDATNLANELGAKVNSSTPTVVKESPTESQFNFAKQLKIDISKMDKEQARLAIKDAIAKKTSEK